VTRGYGHRFSLTGDKEFGQLVSTTGVREFGHLVIKVDSEFEQLVSITNESEFLDELNSYLHPKNSFMEITKRENKSITFIYI